MLTPVVHKVVTARVTNKSFIGHSLRLQTSCTADSGDIHRLFFIAADLLSLDSAALQFQFNKVKIKKDLSPGEGLCKEARMDQKLAMPYAHESEC